MTSLVIDLYLPVVEAAINDIMNFLNTIILLSGTLITHLRNKHILRSGGCQFHVALIIKNRC